MQLAKLLRIKTKQHIGYEQSKRMCEIANKCSAEIHKFINDSSANYLEYHHDIVLYYDHNIKDFPLAEKELYRRFKHTGLNFTLCSLSWDHYKLTISWEKKSNKLFFLTYFLIILFIFLILVISL